jgi:hypothetical protein
VQLDAGCHTIKIYNGEYCCDSCLTQDQNLKWTFKINEEDERTLTPSNIQDELHYCKKKIYLFYLFTTLKGAQ